MHHVLNLFWSEWTEGPVGLTVLRVRIDRFNTRSITNDALYSRRLPAPGQPQFA